MKIAIYHPSINIFGGGELISLAIASKLSENNQVDIYTPYKISLIELQTFFDVSLKNVAIKNLGWSCGFISKMPILHTFKFALYTKKMLKVKGYDLIIDTGTNGMFYKKISTKTICYINFKKFPEFKKGWKSITNFLLIDPKKAFQYDIIITNSKFTRDAIKKYSNSKESLIINPPVFTKDIKVQKHKKNYVLTIGRLTADKKIEVMIDAFKTLYDEGVKNWEFHILGIFRENSGLYEKNYYHNLKSMAQGYPIIFHENMSHQSLLKFIPSCKIYWHARGYVETDPDEMENFGMSTVEAMAAGCVPIVINLGAQPEIVEHGRNGYCWNKPEELVDYSIKVINNNRLFNKLSQKAIKKSRKYSSKIFEKKLMDAINSLF